MHAKSGLSAYQQTSKQDAHYADPHRLIQILMEGFMTRVANARGAMSRGETASKGLEISKAISIVEGLRASLDMERGGELSQSLASLYEYMQSRLLEANLRNDEAKLAEVAGLMREIKAGWDGIREQATGRSRPAGAAGLQTSG